MHVPFSSMDSPSASFSNKGTEAVKAKPIFVVADCTGALLRWQGCEEQRACTEGALR
jgi:hypothetical protein